VIPPETLIVKYRLDDESGSWSNTADITLYFLTGSNTGNATGHGSNVNPLVRKHPPLWDSSTFLSPRYHQIDCSHHATA